MKKNTITFLQIVIVLIGICAITFLFWEPHIEGRNINATAFQIYFNDPFLAYAYIASIPFFLSLYKGFKVLGYIGQGQVFSPELTKDLRTIKYCAIVMIGFVVGGEIFVILSNSGEDRPPAIFMGLLIIAGAGLIHIAASRVERILSKPIR